MAVDWGFGDADPHPRPPRQKQATGIMARKVETVLSLSPRNRSAN
jgi:hypothetical protein